MGCGLWVAGNGLWFVSCELRVVRSGVLCKRKYRISNHEFRMSKEGILSNFNSKIERSATALRYFDSDVRCIRDSRFGF